MHVTAEELLAGKDATYDVAIPAEVLRPGNSGGPPGTVRLRPLTVKDVQLIARAAQDDEVLASVLMIQRSLVEAPLKQAQVAGLSSGLVKFLVERINAISGLSTPEDDVREMARAPLVQAFFVLAREFNWTPQQVRELTVGQILDYLELLNQGRREAAP